MLGRRLSGLAVAALLVVLTGPGPVAGAVEERPVGGGVAFVLKGSNGYSIAVIAGSRRADGRGVATIFVGRGRSSATYSTRAATVTASSVRVDLGALGSIDMVGVPTERTRSVRGCDGDRVDLPASVYEGTFEFRGEGGYTEAAATRLPGREDLFVRILCGATVTGGESWGGPGPGARLAVYASGAGRTPLLIVRKNRPRSRTWIEASVRERRRGIQIGRSTSALVGSAAFDYDPRLRFATVASPAPFSGRGNLRRDAASRPTWTGSLAVDLPGRPNLPLTGRGTRVHIAHAGVDRHALRRPFDATSGDPRLLFPPWPSTRR